MNYNMNKPTSGPKSGQTTPSKRFGHSICVISQFRAILFAGAVADTTYKITNDIFSFNSRTGVWTQVIPKEKKGMPSPRAAHGATAIENLQMVVFGGAQAQGSVVDNELYLLKLMGDESKCKWVEVPVEDPKPPSRYGHTMAFIKPNIFIVGGNIGKTSMLG